MNERDYLLVCLMEECAEISEQVSRISVRASKMLRFSADEVEPGQLLMNCQRLAAELADIIGVIEVLREAGIIDLSQIDRKREKIAKFMQHSALCGVLERKVEP